MQIHININKEEFKMNANPKVMYYLGTQSGVLDVEYLFEDIIFKKFMENMISMTEREFVSTVTTQEYRITHVPTIMEENAEMNDDIHNDAVGIVYLSGKSLDKESTENDIKMIEHRVLGQNGLTSYYLIFIINIIPYKSKRKTVMVLNDPTITCTDRDDKYKFTADVSLAMFDCISRILDYYLDCLCNETEKNNKLHLSNTAQDPYMILMKMYILFLSDYLYPIRDIKFDYDPQSQQEWFIELDKRVTPHLRLDWVQNLSIVSNDKANVFAPQLQLKQSLYFWMYDLFSKCTTKEMHGKFEEWFINGGIYTDEEVPDIVKMFLFAGTDSYSTKAFNDIWKQYI